MQTQGPTPSLQSPGAHGREAASRRRGAAGDMVPTASQPPHPSGEKGVAPQCWWALAGHGEAGRACAGLAVGELPGAQGAPEGPAFFRRQVVSCAGKPSPAGSLTAARGRPSACDLPLKGWFLLSPGIFALCPWLALQSELLSSRSSATKEAKLLELTSQLRKEERVPSCVPCLPLPAALAGSPQAV